MYEYNVKEKEMDNYIERQIIYGKNAVSEAVRSEKEIDTLFVQKGAQLGGIVSEAKKRGVVVKDVTGEKLSAMCGTPKHGGVAAELCAAQYAELDDILAESEHKGASPFIIIADEIADPHNLGAIIRSAEAAGADGVIIPKRRSASLNSTVFKTSAGAAARIKVARVSNLVDTIKTLKKRNIWVYGMEADGSPYDKTDLTDGVAVVVGSEGFGLGRLIRESCDGVLSLPMNGKVNSLNASVAAGILMYEVVRQRRNKQ
ncbi:MAG: 23S rRNA (guanosine(2251)-2'-O)-methyltransferase RlmB [Oscillospiraceae bacterium]|nr:23S rRNA (guanosine(2251)-2'-O)-methyltransferase RlmB [Oscillospiraceae bacterium]